MQKYVLLMINVFVCLHLEFRLVGFNTYEVNIQTLQR